MTKKPHHRSTLLLRLTLLNLLPLTPIPLLQRTHPRLANISIPNKKALERIRRNYRAQFHLLSGFPVLF
jgi:hypothetical protein